VVKAASGVSDWALVCPADRLHELSFLVKVPEGVRFYAEERSGMYSAINSGFRNCEGEWLSYINDDDRLEEGFTAMVKSHCVTGNEAKIAYGRVKMINEYGNSLYDYPWTGRVADIVALWSAGIMPFTQQGMVFHRSVWDRLGGFDGSYRYSGDLDFWVRAHLAGYTFKSYDLTVASWRIRPGQLSSNKSAVQAETKRALAPIRALRLPCSSRNIAKLRFRFRNFFQYLQRISKIGRLTQASVFR
jgi:glycosyltransferase involved in cell wall biosynthesis